jgi:hypothetical protein
MAAKVEKIEPKKERKYTFYMPFEDVDVAAMMIKRGHRRMLHVNGSWDIALLVGGPDICPMLYGERMLPATTINLPRDLKEISFIRSLHHERLKVGICRGGQLLNALAGGRMWQHVDGHLKSHNMIVSSHSGPIRVSSRHHQMMIPGSSAWTIGYAKESLEKVNETFGENELTTEQLEKNPFSEPEVIYYENQHSLCFQPHPEDSDVPECTDFFFECIDAIWSDEKHERALKDW